MAIPAPRSGTMVKVQFKLPAHLVDRIDKEVESQEYSTRTEFLRHLVETHFAEENTISNLDNIVNERIKDGRYDEILKDRLKQILSDKL